MACVDRTIVGPGRSRTSVLLALAALVAGAALGGCSTEDGLLDGGMSGTGDGLGVGTTGSEADEGLATAPMSFPDAEPGPRPFENADPVSDGPAAGLRLANASSRDIRIVVDGDSLRSLPLAPGEPGDLLRIDGGTRELAIVDADTDEAYGRIDASLAPGSLTTLVAFEGVGGTLSVEPLVTRARADDAAVALVRVVRAVDPTDAPARIDAVSLVPDGDAPGGAEAVFSVGADSPVASDYADVTAGDYRLVTGAATTSRALSIEGGAAYTLLFFDEADGGEALLLLLDGEGS